MIKRERRKRSVCKKARERIEGVTYVTTPRGSTGAACRVIEQEYVNIF